MKKRRKSGGKRRDKLLEKYSNKNREGVEIIPAKPQSRAEETKDTIRVAAYIRV